jgi:PEP-CTERM/exosortase A-associated glycosyltransferase
VLHHSAPHLDGYGVRSQSILTCQRAWDIVPTAVTSAHHEIEVRRPAGTTAQPEILDGIRYHRTSLPQGAGADLLLRTPFLRERMFMWTLERAIERVLALGAFDVIHAHSPVLCGWPALRVARRHAIPFVYEVRAFWEDVFLGSALTAGVRIKYAYSRWLETRLMRNAEAVVAISRRLLDEIASRGVSRDRLFHVPNGVDVDRFVPQPRDGALAGKLRLGRGPVLGFIGSFFRWEGLDTLVRAMPRILEREPTTRLVLVGTGETSGEVASLIGQLGLSDSVLLVGRVPHEDVLRYYSVIDVLIYPRLRDRLTDLVTPLKPLEAMAMGKPVIGSDAGGVMELLDEGRAGRLFRAGDSEDLARAALTVLHDEELRRQLAEAGRNYVLRTRHWPTLAGRYKEIYRTVLDSSPVRARHTAGGSSGG